MTAWERAGRPKPPRITPLTYPDKLRRTAHELDHFSFAVIRSVNPFAPWEVRHSRYVLSAFKTHAEAIQYAHKLAQERSQS